MPFGSSTLGLGLTIASKLWAFIRGVFIKDVDLNLFIKRYYKWIIFIGIFGLIFVGFFSVFIELEDTRRQLIDTRRQYDELQERTRGYSHHYHAIKSQLDTLKTEKAELESRILSYEVELDTVQKWVDHCGVSKVQLQNLTCPTRTVTTVAPTPRVITPRNRTVRRPPVSEAPQPKPPTTHALPDTPVLKSEPVEKKRRRWWFRRSEEDTKQ